MDLAHADRDLLLAHVVASQKYVALDALQRGMRVWLNEPSRRLVDVLCEHARLSAEHAALATARVDQCMTTPWLAGLASVPPPNQPQIQTLPPVAAATSHATLPREPIAPADVATLPGAGRVGDYSFQAARRQAPSARFVTLRPHALGGIGLVSVALDQELHREVALKEIQLQFTADAQCRARFLQEAEITGGLEHPGIVPVYSLGEYEDGRPYYAMRFIQGDTFKEAIDRFHRPAAASTTSGSRRHESERARGLELRRLLRRFLDVCNAIDYAHSRGIVHRDLKPGNVMLGKYGETLVVDWGLAKPVNQPEAPHVPSEPTLRPASASGTMPTELGVAVGTPHFMSPEQAACSLADIGSASDIYSLGATLYALLTGKTPYSGGDAATILAQARSAEFPRPRAVDARVPAALEAVCLKAMSRRPADRYPSARELADDVERWLADEPVQAHLESWSERLARWGRRHRKGVRATAAATFLVALVSLVAAVLIEGARQRESVARQEADRQRIRAEASFRDARRAVDGFFTVVSESKLLDVPGLQSLRKDLLSSALTYYRRFIRQRGRDVALQTDLAQTYYRVGRIDAEIGTQSQAARSLRQALRMQNRLVREHPNDAALLSDLANTYNALGRVRQETGQLDAALQAFVRSQKLRADLLRIEPANKEYRRKLANSHNNIASVQARLGEFQQAQEEYVRANAARKMLADQFPSERSFQVDLAKGHYNLALLLQSREDAQGALDSLAESRRILREVVARDSRSLDNRRELALASRVFADLASEQGQIDAAQLAFQESQQLAEQLARQNPIVVDFQADLAALYVSLARARRSLGEPASAVEWLEKAAVIQESLVQSDPSVLRWRQDLAEMYLSLGQAQDAAGQAATANTTLLIAQSKFESLGVGPGHDAKAREGLARVLLSLGQVSRSAGDFDQAQIHFTQARQAYESLSEPTRAAGQANVELNAALCWRDSKAVEPCLEALSRAQALLAPLLERHDRRADLRRRLAEVAYLTGVVQFEQGELAAAVEPYEQARDLRQRLVNDNPRHLEDQAALGTALDELGVVLWKLERDVEALNASWSATDHLRAAWNTAPGVIGYRRGLSNHLANLSWLMRESSQPSESARLLQERKQLWPGDPDELYSVAAELAETAESMRDDGLELGDKELAQQRDIVAQALQTLREAVAAGFNHPDQLRHDARFIPWTDMPEFQAILQEISP